MTRKRGKSRKSSADKRAFRYKRKYVIDALTKRPKILLPTWELYLRKEEINLDFLETMLFPQFETCGVPLAEYDYYMAWVKERAKRCLAFKGTTLAEEYAILKQVFVNRGLSATILDCLAPTVDSWNEIMLGKGWSWNFDTGTAQGWKLAHTLCCLNQCQDPSSDALPFIYGAFPPPLTHSPYYAVVFCRTKNNNPTTLGSAYPLDLRAWLGVTTDVRLSYWYRVTELSDPSMVQFYDMDTGTLLKGYSDYATAPDVFKEFLHTDLSTLLGKRVCLVYSRSVSWETAVWDDITFYIKGILSK